MSAENGKRTQNAGVAAIGSRELKQRIYGPVFVFIGFDQRRKHVEASAPPPFQAAALPCSIRFRRTHRLFIALKHSKLFARSQSRRV
jgi:hypothetical protein